MFRLRRVKSFDKLKDVFKSRRKRCEDEGNVNEMVSIDDESPIAMREELLSNSTTTTPSHFSANNGKINKFLRSFRKKIKGNKKKSDKIGSLDSEKCTNLIEEFEQLSEDESRGGLESSEPRSSSSCSTNDASNYIITTKTEDTRVDNLDRKSQTQDSCLNPSHSVYERALTPAVPSPEAYSTSVVNLIEESIKRSHEGVFCYSRGRSPDSPSFPVRLTKPVSRFTQVRSLQYLCRFLIRQYTRVDHIQKLPLPPRIKGYLEEGHY
ncbi:Suppressor of cytokine signaling-like protein [Dinothrombium tinctorium]|uniref:Suppressor of cytokine signaling-like protein n=1 Tax=Dinothrombium tinctorium TaxID=1965070 RepID=A0A3S3S7C9_9ACAR|nr:Suppressor of cytokine signaling-like protein [Dinothrombium tinctorium]